MDIQKIFSEGFNEKQREIKKLAKLAVFVLNNSGYRVGYSLESLKELDRFFELDSYKHLLKSSHSKILRAVGCCLGEAIIWNYGGSWITDDESGRHPHVEMKNGRKVYPFAICDKKRSSPETFSITRYVFSLTGRENTNL